LDVARVGAFGDVNSSAGSDTASVLWCVPPLVHCWVCMQMLRHAITSPAWLWALYGRRGILLFNMAE
jgi:hypothetical protein